MSINITKHDLLRLNKEGILTLEKADEIWRNLSNNPVKTQFNIINVLYFLGALITISAMTWFATEAFSEFQGAGLMVISIAYFLVFFFAGNYFIKKEKMEIPGGQLLTVAVFMVPLLVYAIQECFDIWGFGTPGDYNDFYYWIKSAWFFMELATISVSLIFILKYRFTFLTFPLALSLWFMSMDIVPILIEAFAVDLDWWETRRMAAIIFGLVLIIVSYFTDRKTKKDYSFWLYLFGLIAFWGSITAGHTDSLLDKSLYCLLNLFFIFVSVALKRKVFIVFGSIGVFLFLADLSYSVFRDSLLFPFFLSLIGVGFIVLGILYAKNSEKIEAFIFKKTPHVIKTLIPKAK